MSNNEVVGLIDELENEMGTKAQAPIASRWMLKRETKGRVFFVLARAPFGKLLMKQEDRAVTADATVKDLLENWVRVEGVATMPAGWMA